VVEQPLKALREGRLEDVCPDKYEAEGTNRRVTTTGLVPISVILAAALGHFPANVPATCRTHFLVLVAASRTEFADVTATS